MQRHRCNDLALRHEQLADLDHSTTDPAQGLGCTEAEQVGGGERGPQLSIDTVLGPLDLAHPIRGDEAGEDARHRLIDRLLLFREGEVHGVAPSRP